MYSRWFFRVKLITRPFFKVQKSEKLYDFLPTPTIQYYRTVYMCICYSVIVSVMNNLHGNLQSSDSIQYVIQYYLSLIQLIIYQLLQLERYSSVYACKYVSFPKPYEIARTVQRRSLPYIQVPVHHPRGLQPRSLGLYNKVIKYTEMLVTQWLLPLGKKTQWLICISVNSGVYRSCRHHVMYLLLSFISTTAAGRHRMIGTM